MIQHQHISLSRFLAILLILAISILSLTGMVGADPKESQQTKDQEDPSLKTKLPSFQDGYPAPWPQEEGSRKVGVTILPEEAAYYHLVLLPDNAKAPSKEQVKNGTDGDGNPAMQVMYNSSKTTGISVQILAGEHSTEYDVYVVLRDDAGNLSEPAKVDVTSPEPAYLIKGDGLSLSKGEDGSRQVRVRIYLDNIEDGYKGKVYWVLLPKGAKEPSIEQIAAGTDGNDRPAISAGRPEFDPSEGDGHFIVTGAVGNTDYDLYLVVGDTMYGYPLARCTEIQHLEVTTPPDVVDEKVCEMNGKQYTTLADALNEAGSTATIKLLKSFTTIESVVIDKKNITFDLNGQILTINTTADEGLKVTEGTVSLLGEGQLNVSGKVYGVYASSGSKVTVTNATAWDDYESISSTSAGVLALSGSKVTVLGNATGYNHGIRAENIYTEVTVAGDVSNGAQIKGAVHSEGQAVVLVKGNVTATRGYGVRSYSGKITVNKNVSGNLAGAMAEGIDPEIHIKGDIISHNNGAIIMSSSGIIIVDGEIKGSGSNPVPRIYISIGSTQLEKDNGVPDPARPGYLKYSYVSASSVWVKDPLAASIWEVSNALELENALNNFKDGDTIKLTANIDYNKGIVIDGKTVTFDVGNYILNVNSSTPSAGSNGLLVKNSGHVKLAGTGQFNISLNGGNTSTGVKVEAGSSAVVTNIEVLVESGSAFGAYADGSSADIHVLGNINVIGEGGCGARTWGRGKITVEGTIKASAYINIGTTYKDKSSGIEDPNRLGYLKYSTPPNETGIIWVKVEKPVPTYIVTVNNGTGDGDYVEGEVVTITANEAPEGQRFKEWKITLPVNFVDNTSITSQTAKFIMPAQPVLATAIYETLPAPEYTITVQNNGNGTAVADVNSAVEGTEISLTATANSGYKFKEWKVISGGITITDNKFTMPAVNVIVKAIFEAITVPTPIPTPVPSYSLIVNRGTGSGNYAKGVVVTITADKAPEGQIFDRWTSKDGIAFANAYDTATTFIMPDKDVTISATYKNADSRESFRILTDKPTGISIAGKLSEDAKLTVSGLVLEDCSACKTIQEKIKDKNYEFILGKSIALTGSYTGRLVISVPLGSKYNGKTVSVLYVKQDGTLNTDIVTVKDGNAIFETASLSYFAVFIKEDSRDNPKTGDTLYPWRWLLLCFISVVIMALLKIVKKEKRLIK